MVQLFRLLLCVLLLLLGGCAETPQNTPPEDPGMRHWKNTIPLVGGMPVRVDGVVR